MNEKEKEDVKQILFNSFPQPKVTAYGIVKKAKTDNETQTKKEV